MAKRTIILKDFLKVFEEYEAAAAITPGMLLEYTSAGKVQAHSTAGANAIPMLALEDELQGNDIDDDYASGAQVQCWIPQRGAQALMILADGQNVSKGDLLESDGNGMLQVHEADSASTIYPNQIVGEALEDLDLSGSSGEESSGALGYDKRIQVRIL